MFKGDKALLAPLAGISDAAFRGICIEQGAYLCYTEMVSAKGLSYANEKTSRLLSLASNESFVAVQLFGHESDVLAKQAAAIEDELGERLAYIDINMGCPARKIVSKQDGCALMKQPRLAHEIVSEVRKVISCPLSVKFRRGFELNCETAPEFAHMLEDAGASFFAIHGRYAAQLFSGKSDMSVINRVKEKTSLPIIGNGDITCGEDAKKMIEQTGCEAVMIGRASFGNPWIFAEVKSALSGDKSAYAKPCTKEKIEMARRHAHLLSEGGRKALIRMRKHAMWYTYGFKNASSIRLRINECASLEDFDKLFDELASADEQNRL
ncbi:MAG: tRNA dihydrouridine synthase DusB [Eggerthellaceae bacterium]|nr:tRNA dihydrouridine synthase DusB [Eggerthellaceae bacterium]